MEAHSASGSVRVFFRNRTFCSLERFSARMRCKKKSQPLKVKIKLEKTLAWIKEDYNYCRALVSFI